MASFAAHASRVEALAVAQGPVPLTKIQGRVVGMRRLSPDSWMRPSGEKAAASKTKWRWHSSAVVKRSHVSSQGTVAPAAEAMMPASRHWECVWESSSASV